MDKTLEKLTKYDIVGYILPGITLLFIVNFELNPVWRDLRLPALGDFEGAVFLVASAYLLGTLTHELSEIFQKHILLRIVPLPSEKILLNLESHYAEPFVRNLHRKLKRDFKISGIKSGQAGLFALMYSYINAKGLNSRSSAFNSMYGLYRNLAVIFIAFTFWKLLSMVFTGLSHWTLALIVPADVFMLISSTLISFLLLRRLIRFGKRFASAVVEEYAAHVGDSDA